MVLKDFNIRAEAKENQTLNKNFTALVTDNTLEIHFYWGGKGSIYISPGLYGPLISAISATRMWPLVNFVYFHFSRFSFQLMIIPMAILSLTLPLLYPSIFRTERQKALHSKYSWNHWRFCCGPRCFGFGFLLENGMVGTQKFSR